MPREEDQSHRGVAGIGRRRVAGAQQRRGAARREEAASNEYRKGSPSMQIRVREITMNLPGRELTHDSGIWSVKSEPAVRPRRSPCVQLNGSWVARLHLLYALRHTTFACCLLCRIRLPGCMRHHRSLHPTVKPMRPAAARLLSARRSLLHHYSAAASAPLFNPAGALPPGRDLQQQQHAATADTLPPRRPLFTLERSVSGADDSQLRDTGAFCAGRGRGSRGRRGRWDLLCR